MLFDGHPLCCVDSTFDSRTLRRTQTARDKNGLKFWPHLTGETGSDGEKRSAAFSKNRRLQVRFLSHLPLTNPETKRLQADKRCGSFCALWAFDNNTDTGGEFWDYC